MDVMAVNFRVCRVFDRMLRLVVCQWIALGRLAFQHGWLVQRFTSNAIKYAIMRGFHKEPSHASWSPRC